MSCVSGGSELPDAARTKRNNVHYSIILFTVLFFGVFMICRVTAHIPQLFVRVGGC